MQPMRQLGWIEDRGGNLSSLGLQWPTVTGRRPLDLTFGVRWRAAGLEAKRWAWASSGLSAALGQTADCCESLASELSGQRRPGLPRLLGARQSLPAFAPLRDFPVLKHSESQLSLK